MTPKKRFVVFSMLVFGVITGLIFLGTREAKVQTGIGCQFERQAAQDSQSEKTELLRLIESVGRKNRCSDLMHSN